MDHCDVAIVGGGPAGSTCAWRLRQAGLDVLVLDKADFPRPKLCAGWITPAVLAALHVDPDEYGRGRVFQPMNGFRIGLMGGGVRQIDYGRPVSFGICRAQFDDYLLRRCGARLLLAEPLKALRRDGNAWVLNERVRTPMLVAAGGHFCPVARMLGRHERSRADPVIVSQEFEVPLTLPQQAACPVDPCVPELYFCDDLLGYGWCIRKGDVLNVGLGREDRRGLPQHLAAFCQLLTRRGRIDSKVMGKFQGHAYLLYAHATRKLLCDGLLWIGDAAGLACAESGEGIRPAVESGLLAARAIVAAQGDYCCARLEPYGRWIQSRFGPRRTRPAIARP
ncbi:MAG: NAD(P)/FAD-dependent oxidoreductase, partial [Thermoguttaceae bacterium]